MKWGKVGLECASCGEISFKAIGDVQGTIIYNMASVPKKIAKQLDGGNFSCYNCGKFNVVNMPNIIKMETEILYEK
jgi:predicted RNA-binding Zn-ribbon protein involved in translation (DUF1610 family)